MGDVFEINEQGVESYFYWTIFFIIIAYSWIMWFTIIGIPLVFIFAFAISPNIARKQTRALKYWLEGPILRIEEGIVFKKKKAIPLGKITDVALCQGPLLRRCNIWRLDIQTAGTVSMYSEARLYGLKDPEGVREKILAKREEIMQKRA